MLRGRVEWVNEQTIAVGDDRGVHVVRLGGGERIKEGDIVEVASREGGASVRLLVRPRRPPRKVNPRELRTVLQARGMMVSCIREFFFERGFVEVPTPSLVLSPGMEPHLTGFSADYVDLAGKHHRRWLPTSPEFSLKRALCAGLTRVFEIKTVFRNNGESSPLHSPEFTMLEWYRAYADYRAIMRDTELLLEEIARRLSAWLKPFRGIQIHWHAPYPRLSVREAVRRYAGIDLEGYGDEERFRMLCQSRLSHVCPDEDFDSLFHRLMIELVEPHLGVPTPVILYDYPISMAALAVARADDPSLCERFELYAAGVELANAFTEVNDAREMAQRIRHARREQRALGVPCTPADGALLRAMREGMPPSAGIAMGLDRVLMAMLGREHIADTLPFCLHDPRSLRQKLPMICENAKGIPGEDSAHGFSRVHYPMDDLTDRASR